MPQRQALTGLIFAATMLLAAHPAAASGTAQVPEASSLSLFALGVLGVIVGRRLSIRRSDKDD